MSDPTQARDAEASLLGAILAGYSDIDALAELVDADDFADASDGDIFDAAMRVHRAGNRPDAVSVRLALTAAAAKHDPLRLLHLANVVPNVAQAPYYAEQVATASALRRIYGAGLKLQQLGSVHRDIDTAREEARAEVDKATRGKHASKARTLADLLPDVIDTAQHGRTNVLSTGWPDLDRVIGGLAPGRLVVVGARPGVGKSLLGTNLALHFAHYHQHAVLLASLEMPEIEVGQRLLAAHAGVNLTGLQMGTTDERSWDQIAAKNNELTDMAITVDDAPGQTITSIRSAARNVQRTRDDLALIIVDYLQLVRPTDSRVGRVEQIGEISRGLKLLARETGACVVAMAQVNREAAKHGDGKPRLTDLRESGSIEADADQVVLLHRADWDVPEVDLLIDKNRHGPTGQAQLLIQGHYARLVSAQWTPTKGLAS